MQALYIDIVMNVRFIQILSVCTVFNRTAVWLDQHRSEPRILHNPIHAGLKFNTQTEACVQCRWVPLIRALNLYLPSVKSNNCFFLNKTQIFSKNWNVNSAVFVKTIILTCCY